MTIVEVIISSRLRSGYTSVRHHSALLFQDGKMSAKLNMAYDTLSDAKARQQYERRNPSHGISTSFSETPGLVGPLKEVAIPLQVRPHSQKVQINSCTRPRDVLSHTFQVNTVRMVSYLSSSTRELKV
jgi:hypothetical protein